MAPLSLSDSNETFKVNSICFTPTPLRP